MTHPKIFILVFGLISMSSCATRNAESDREILNLAENNYDLGKYPEAIVQANKVKSDSVLYEDSQQLIKKAEIEQDNYYKSAYSHTRYISYFK
jgi:hypothetical protein